MAYYFASDMHLGLRYRDVDPVEREKVFVEWLSGIEHDCQRLFLIGDVFDFWFEWKRVVPRGFVRVLGKLASMRDKGIEIDFFAGNHDMWLTDYLSAEAGIRVHNAGGSFVLQGRQVFIDHGDTLGRREWQGRTLSKWFRSKYLRWLFSHLIHPDAAMRFGYSWSASSRHAREGVAHEFRFEEELLVVFAREYLEEHKIDYFVFGHLHTPVEYPLTESSTLIVLGEWIENPAYARMEDGLISLHNLIE